jgi:molybdopterin-containing oxidoreductase family membrane subunit
MDGDILRPLVTAGRRYYILVLLLSLVAGWGLFAWIYQIRNGMGVAGLDHPVFWGLYITNFVFWVGISHSGTMISAILRLTKAEWRYPITRPAEMMTIFSVAVAGIFPLVHLGRAWLFFYLIPLPNERGLWPNFRSPLVWDAMAITAYLTGSMLFLYLPLVPDLARYKTKVGFLRGRLYRILSLGWRGTLREWRWLQRAATILTVVIIPVAVSVHTIVSWDFGMTLVPGWHSAIFAPYFVVGAIFSGGAAVVTLMIVLRWTFAFERYLTPYHFDQLGKLLLAFSLLWMFFFGAEILTIFFANEPHETQVLAARSIGQYRYLFVLMVVVNFVLPVVYLSFRRLRTWIPGILLVSLLINVGMYLERFLIIVPSLAHGGTPFSWGSYTPTWVEISITAGSFAGFCLLYAVFAKVFPILSVWEIKEGRHVRAERSIDGVPIPVALAHDAEPDLPPPPPPDKGEAA